MPGVGGEHFSAPQGADLQTGLGEMRAGDVWQMPGEASKRLPVVSHPRTLLYLIPLSGDR